MDRDQAGNSLPFREDLADAMPGSLRSDHRHVDILGRRDEPEVNIEAVGEHQRLAGSQVRLDIFLVDLALNVIRHQHHDDVGCFRGIRNRENFQPGGFRFGFALAAFRQADNRIQAGIAQIQRVRVPLAAVADNGDCLAL